MPEGVPPSLCAPPKYLTLSLRFPIEFFSNAPFFLLVLPRRPQEDNMKEPTLQSHEVLAFKLGKEEYGIGILAVREIRGYEAVTVSPTCRITSRA